MCGAKQSYCYLTFPRFSQNKKKLKSTENILHDHKTVLFRCYNTCYGIKMILEWYVNVNKKDYGYLLGPHDSKRVYERTCTRVYVYTVPTESQNILNVMSICNRKVTI